MTERNKLEVGNNLNKLKQAKNSWKPLAIMPRIRKELLINF